MDLNAFLRYWSLTLAVFVFYLFAFLVAALDIVSELAEAARKKRAAEKPTPLDPNPLAGKTVAQTMLPGPGQQLDAKREWVARLARAVVQRAGASVQTVVLEDSKGHPLVHFSDGTRVESYRVDRILVEAAMAADTAKVAEVRDLLTRHLRADFLGREDERPPRVTELAREAAAKPAAQAPGAQAAPAPAGETAPAAPAAETAASAAGTAAAPDKPAEQMSREERLAAARAKAEALRKAREQGTPPST